MTDEMLDARPRQRRRGRRRATSSSSRATSRRSRCPTRRVDVVISNCVINLAADKPQVLREAARVLRPGGRFAVSDVIADPDMDEATRADMAAVDRLHRRRADRAPSSRAALAAAGLVDVEIRETHRVHEHAASAIVRARRP